MINTLCPGWVAVLWAGVRGAGVCEPLLPLHISLHHGQLHPGAAPGEAIAELLQNTDTRKNSHIHKSSKQTCRQWYFVSGLASYPFIRVASSTHTASL